jgi:hypothetical protein
MDKSFYSIPMDHHTQLLKRTWQDSSLQWPMAEEGEVGQIDLACLGGHLVRLLGDLALLLEMAFG